MSLAAIPPGSSGVVYISTYPPRRCGLATFTFHLAAAVAATGRLAPGRVIALEEPGNQRRYPPAVAAIIRQDVPSDYTAAAEAIDRSGAGVVSLQHEYGIFGGEAGEYVLGLARRLQTPLVATLHTVLTKPDPHHYRVLAELARLCRGVVVMSHLARQILQDLYRVPPSKIWVIPHGTPLPDLPRRRAARQKLGLAGRLVLCTFGLLSRGKGIEYALRALPEVISRQPRLLYLIVGQTHPSVLKLEGERYREELAALTQELGISAHVRFVNEYLTETDLADYLLATDVYLTPYPGDQQICSGTLTYAVGMGKVVISTAYPYARELLGDGTGILVPFREEKALASALLRVATSRRLREELARRARARGSTMSWPRVGELYARLFAALIQEKRREWSFGAATARPVAPA